VTTLDASTLVTLFNSRDANHNLCVTWFRQAIADGDPLRAPVTVLAEVAAAISRGTGDRQLARDVATQVRHSALFELLPVALPLAERAIAIAADYDIAAGSALCLAVADTLSDRLVTFDPELLSKGPNIVETCRPGS
jgi:predicted nucleic acid-binding protein